MADSVTTLDGSELLRATTDFTQQIRELDAAQAAQVAAFERALKGFEANLAALGEESRDQVLGQLKSHPMVPPVVLDKDEWPMFAAKVPNVREVSIDELQLKWNGEASRLEIRLYGETAVGGGSFGAGGPPAPFEALRATLLRHAGLVNAMNRATAQLRNAVGRELAARRALLGD